MGGRCKGRCCQTSPVLQLKTDRAEQNSLEAEIMEGQGSTAGCSGIGWIDGWMARTYFFAVLIFGTVCEN
jgi:hypothetical protein